VVYRHLYETGPEFSDILLFGDGECLTGLWFAGSPGAEKYAPEGEWAELPVFRQAAEWLDAYFAGEQPDFTPLYRIDGLTEFRRDVTEAMLAIPYGETTTYGAIARSIAEKRGCRTSARAGGGAVGRNPLSILIPCHRVVGADGSLTGYSGGMQNKIALLKLERHGKGK